MEELVERAKKNDEQAFDEIILMMEKEMYLVARSKLNNDDDISDAIQETIIICFKNIIKLKDNSLFKTWIIRILINECNKIYKKKKKTEFAQNVQLQVDTGVIAFIEHFDGRTKTGYHFSLDKFVNKKLVSHLTAASVSYDTLSDERYHWRINNYTLRELKGMREYISHGSRIDSIIAMEPSDFLLTRNQQETLTSPELKEYIVKQRARGSGNVKPFEVEYQKRFATPFASFILTIIGLSLSARKRKGGMGLYLGIGLALSASYILFQTVSSTFAINADWPPALAAWLPNIIFAFIAFFLYKKAPQ